MKNAILISTFVFYLVMGWLWGHYGLNAVSGILLGGSLVLDTLYFRTRLA